MISKHPNASKRWPIVFNNPVEMLYYFDEDLISGKKKLYDWQVERMMAFAKPREKPTDIIRLGLIAANGSGKSQFVLAPCLVWFSLTFDDSIAIVTTASGEQLDTQAFRYTTKLCERINSKLKGVYPEGVFDCKYRKFKNLVTGGHIDMFATDEAGKAEGRHPIIVDGEMAIFVDEAKTVGDHIFEALDRCTGFTRRFDMSSAGSTQGNFYDICTLPDSPYNIKKVTAFDCPHLDKTDIEWKIAKYTINDPLIQSMIFSNFSSLDDQIVITRDSLKYCSSVATPTKFGKPRAGLDLSAGGDETVLSVWHGNEQIGLETMRIADTAKLAKYLIELFKKYRIPPQNIYADDGGLGRGILDGLAEQRWKVARVLNQSRPADSTRYANRGSELWFHFKRFVDDGQVVLLPDKTQTAQLVNRFYKVQTSTGKLILESKVEAKRKGHPSPDRADATILAWASVSYPLHFDEVEKPKAHGVTVEELARIMRTPKESNPEDDGRGNLSSDGNKYLVTNRFCGFRLSKIVDFMSRKSNNHLRR